MNPYDELEAGRVDLALASEDFEAGGQLPESATGTGTTPGGQDLSPQLSWKAGPEGTQAYMVSCYDPDAPTPSGYWHWVAINLPASVTSLVQGAGDELPEGAINLKNDGGTAAFQGAAPPPGHGPHRYIFTVHALDSRLDLDGEARPAVAHFMARGHILGRGMLIGTWENAG